MLGHQPTFKHYAYVIFSNLATLLAVVVGTIVVVALAQGYRYDLASGEVSLTGLLRVQSSPISANVWIDEQDTQEQTPFKRTFDGGSHSIGLRADGYRDWNKTLSISGGKVEYVAYPRLLPEKLVSEDMLARPATAGLNFDPRGRYALATQADAVEFIDLNETDMLSQSLEIPFLEPTARLSHVYWADSSEDTVLLRYVQQDQPVYAWLDLTTQTVEDMSEALSGFTVTHVNNQSFIASKQVGDIWAIDIEDQATTPLTSSSEHSAVSRNYVAWKEAGKTNLNVWDGEQTVQAFEFDSKQPLESFDVLEYDNKVNVVYHADTEGVRSVQNLLGTQTLKNFKAATGYVSSSSADRFVLVTTADGYASFDFEKAQLFTFTPEAPLKDIRWADDFTLFANEAGSTVWMEFDGANKHVLQKSLPQDITFSSSHRFLYSFATNAESKTTVLSRTDLIVER